MERAEIAEPPKFYLTDNQREVLRRTHLWVKSFFDEAAKDNRVVMGSHGLDHNERVAGMAAFLASEEGYEPFLSAFTSLLFDVGRTSKDPRAHNFEHGRLSVEIAKDFIESVPLLSPDNRILVMNAMADHPLLNKDVRESWLVKIVQDADRLDTIGALAPVRAAATRWKLPLYADKVRNSVEEKDMETIYQDFAVRIPKWVESIWTETAKEIAVPRLEFLMSFIKEYDIEAGFMLRAFKNLELN